MHDLVKLILNHSLFVQFTEQLKTHPGPDTV